MNNLGALDYALFISYMIVLFGIGAWFSRQQKDLKTYLLADRDIHWVIVAISVMAALFSGITYMAAPAETFFHDLQYLWVSVSFIIATPIATLLFMPFFRGLNLVTAYEYLERRFDWRLRKIASALFIGRVTLYVATAIYAPALAINAITGMSLGVSIVLTGISATIYTTLGGMKAVIWTDSLQFLVLCGGILVIIAFAGADVPGGIAGAWKLAAADGKTRVLDFSLNPTTRVTFWAAFIGGCANNLVQLVTDQISVQRYLTAKSLGDAQRALWLKLAVTLPIMIVFYSTGTIIYGYYKAHPDQIPNLASAKDVPKLDHSQVVNPEQGSKLRDDQLLPYFVVNQLPSPLPGLLIAALYGTTMAVVAAGVNSLSTATLMDFRPDTRNGVREERRSLLWAKGLTLGFGLLATGAAFLVGHIGSLMKISSTLLGILGGPLLGMFLLGVLSRRTNSLGVLVGIPIGIGVGVCVAFSKLLFGVDISFLWTAASATVATMVSSWLISWLDSAPTAEQVAYTHGGRKEPQK